MKQEDKDLLLKDICSRLPYSLLISIDGNRYRLEEIRNALIGINTYKITFDGCDIEDMNIKPYLFPLSSMTTKQKAELSMLTADSERMFDSTLIEIEFYHKYHFDYRNLINKNLAIDCTNLNIY